MDVKTVFIFKTLLGNNVENNFESAEDLKKFIKNFDFTKRYSVNGVPVSSNFEIGVFPPVFKIGYRFETNINGYNFKSEPVWTPDLWIAKSIQVSYVKNTDLVSYKMMIPYISKNNYKEHFLTVPKTANFYFVDKENLKQMYPVVDQKDSEINKIISRAITEQQLIKEH